MLTENGHNQSVGTGIQMVSCYPPYRSRACRYPCRAIPDRYRAYRDRKRYMACHLMIEYQDSAMKVKCPGCGYIAGTRPSSLKCPKCDEFSDDWLIYDWDSFSLIKRRHIRCNLLIVGVALVNLLVAIVFKPTDVRHLLLSLLLMPAIFSLFNCRKQLRRKSEYRGHRSADTSPWFTGGGPFLG